MCVLRSRKLSFKIKTYINQASLLHYIKIIPLSVFGVKQGVKMLHFHFLQSLMCWQ